MQQFSDLVARHHRSWLGVRPNDRLKCRSFEKKLKVVDVVDVDEVTNQKQKVIPPNAFIVNATGPTQPGDPLPEDAPCASCSEPTPNAVNVLREARSAG